MPCLMGLSKARVKGSTSANKRTLGVIPALVSVAAAVLGVDPHGELSKIMEAKEVASKRVPAT